MTTKKVRVRKMRRSVIIETQEEIVQLPFKRLFYTKRPVAPQRTVDLTLDQCTSHSLPAVPFTLPFTWRTHP